MSFHINGGPVSIDDKYFKIISKDTDIFMQVCTAGNLRTAIICANEAYQNNVFERFLSILSYEFDIIILEMYGWYKI